MLTELKNKGMLFACIVFIALPAQAAMKDEIKLLTPLKLSEGINRYLFQPRPIMIVKARFASETASGAEGYSVLVKDDAGWQYARIQEGAQNEVILWSYPHTSEDAVRSIMF